MIKKNRAEKLDFFRRLLVIQVIMLKLFVFGLS